MGFAAAARDEMERCSVRAAQELGKAFGVGITVGVAMELFELFIIQPLLARWIGKMPDLSDFADLVGNLKLLLIYLALVWVLGALGEELVYCGYLMNRAAGLFRSPNVAWTVSLVVVSVAFGCAHIDQGSTGTVRILRTDQYSVVVSGERKKPCGAGDCTCILGYA
jgi:membrane protease YdiL (CAAX protease family)